MQRVWEEMELEPNGDLEAAIARGDTKDFVLSEANMLTLQDLRQKVDGRVTAYSIIIFAFFTTFLLISSLAD